MKNQEELKNQALQYSNMIRERYTEQTNGWYYSFPSEPKRGSIDFPIDEPIFGFFIDKHKQKHEGYLMCFSFDGFNNKTNVCVKIDRRSEGLGFMTCQIPFNKFVSTHKFVLPSNPF